MSEQISPGEEREHESTLDQIRAALEIGLVADAIAVLVRLHPADRAVEFRRLEEEHQSALLSALDVPAMADLFEELSDEKAADLAETLTTARLADVLDEMEPDEAADILGDIPPARAAMALAEMEDAEEVIPLLGHPDETAGGLMTTSFIALRRRTTGAQAIQFLREIGPDVEKPYYLNVVDRDGRLIGIVGLRDLVVADPDTPVENFMDHEVIHVAAGMDQEDVARLMARYDLAAVPVVDNNQVLLGVITYDDLVEVLEEEATEDLYRLANVSDRELSLDTPISLTIRRRLPWLYVSALTALFASWVISQFEAIIAQVALLAAFQSVVAGLGGNTGTQSLAIIVRAIALGEVELRRSWHIILKEAATGLLQGAAVGVAAGLSVYLWTDNAFLGLVLGFALVGNMLVAGIFGTLIPLALKAANLDPALASSVLVTTVTDSVGFALFLGLAALFLPRLV